MQLNDDYIISLNPELLFNREIFLSLLEVEDPAEKRRLTSLLKAKADEYGCKKDFIDTLKEYNDLEQKLAESYKRANRQQGNIDLDFDANGKPMITVDNFLQIVRNDPKFKGLKFNLLTYSPEQERDGETVRWTDADDAETRRYIEKKYKIHNVQKCDDALRIVFAENEYHPIRDMIDSFEWDGQNRISEFLHFATKCDDNSYTREVSRLIFAGGIHRLYEPGCKFDDMPVLIGTKQGEGKSTLVRWLALKDEYFTEVNEFDGRNGIEALEGAWICEVSELLALTKTKEQEAVKSYLSRLNDRYRMPYDKRTTDHKRQCLFIGTTNKKQFLTDKTGNRRFYPVEVKQQGYDMFDRKDEIQAYIRQCWAEAKAKLDDEFMKPYADRNLKTMIQTMQDDATEDDYRVGMIEGYLESKTEVCILQIWRIALDMGEYTKPKPKESSEIAMILNSFDDWEKQPSTKRFGSLGPQKWWKKIK